MSWKGQAWRKTKLTFHEATLGSDILSANNSLFLYNWCTPPGLEIRHKKFTLLPNWFVICKSVPRVLSPSLANTCQVVKYCLTQCLPSQLLSYVSSHMKSTSPVCGVFTATSFASLASCWWFSCLKWLKARCSVRSSPRRLQYALWRKYRYRISFAQPWGIRPRAGSSESTNHMLHIQ